MLSLIPSTPYVPSPNPWWSTRPWDPMLHRSRWGIVHWVQASPPLLDQGRILHIKHSKLRLLLPKSFSHNLQISTHSSLPIVIICAIKVGGLANTIARHSFTSKWLTLQINWGLTLIPLEKIFGWLEGVNNLTKKSTNSQTLDKEVRYKGGPNSSTLVSVLQT